MINTYKEAIYLLLLIPLSVILEEITLFIIWLFTTRHNKKEKMSLVKIISEYVNLEIMIFNEVRKMMGIKSYINPNNAELKTIRQHKE